MTQKSASFRVGKVRVYRRGKVWYLSYHENGRRRRPRVGTDRDQARQLAAQINGQLEVGAPAALSFEPISIPDLRQRWLDHHEYVRRSSLQTIRRYRTATEHLLTFMHDVCPVRRASDFHPRHAEDFVRYLRGIQVASNGHSRARTRALLDAGLKFILETCSTLFDYAQRNRHLSPYAENPFRTIEISRVPIEEARPIYVFTADQEGEFLEACDDWQFPLFLTLLLTGLRPGELAHLLLPDDLDLETRWLRVRNKPELGWQVKTRNERDLPLVPALAEVLARAVGDRHTGPVFRQRQYVNGYEPGLHGLNRAALCRELALRKRAQEVQAGVGLTRAQQLQVAKTLWRAAGAFVVVYRAYDPVLDREVALKVPHRAAEIGPPPVHCSSPDRDEERRTCRELSETLGMLASMKCHGARSYATHTWPNSSRTSIAVKNYGAARVPRWIAKRGSVQRS